MDNRVTHVIERMEALLHHRVVVPELAAEVGLSPSRLAYLFRTHTGHTTAAYLQALRMERARILLERTTLSVREVMQQVGVADPSHFSRDFRNAHGLSPRAYRLQLRLAGPPQRYIARAADLRADAPNGGDGAARQTGMNGHHTKRENEK